MMRLRPKGQSSRGKDVDCDEITGGVWDRVSTPAMANHQPSKPRVTTSQTITSASVSCSSAQLGRHCAGVRDEAWEDEEVEADQEADQVDSTFTCSQTPTYDTVSPYSEDPDVVIEDVEYIDGCDVDVEPDPHQDSHHRTGGGQRGATGGFEPGRGRGQRGAIAGCRRPREATDHGRGSGRHGDKPPATQQEQTQSQNQTRAPKGRPPTQNKTGKLGKHTQMYDPCVTPLEVNPLGLSGTQSESAISRHEITSGERLFYGAHVGSETRNVEFKRGGGEYLRLSFRTHLRRYACAFLNSGGGSLLAGVDDNGVVRGLHCDHRQEDQARLLVDSILKGFHPTLLPHSYTLAFLPVVRPGPEGKNLKVLRLTLRPPPALTQQGLYQTDQGEVFLRRDGSVEGPLSASAIQEWARQRWSGEVSRLQHCVEVLLSEQRLLLQEIRQQSQAIAALQSAQTQAQSQAQGYTQAPTQTPTQAPTQAPTQTHIHVHTHTQARAHVKTPATESLGDRLMQILGKAGRATPLDQEVSSVTPAAPSSALPLVPFMAPDLDLLRDSPGRAHLCPSLSPGHNQSPGPPHCPQCQCTECRSNICRLM